MKYRPGFEPEKSAAPWVGKRVEARIDSGWGMKRGYFGTVKETVDEPAEYGWFYLIPDNGTYPEGILAHTAEFYSPAETEGKERKPMFSVKQKREIADAVQKILRATAHPELPTGEIQFQLYVKGAEDWSFSDIKNNGAVPHPTVNIHNEMQDPRGAKKN